jgi:site-specific DNA-methyltransferase (adenine-specific)
LSCRFFTASHETLLWARKDKKAKHTFNYEIMKNCPWPGDQLKKPNTQMRSVWSINTPPPTEKRFGKHPTQKPSSLLKRIVLASTNKGDLVVDPFAGSSTTGLVAYFYGRDFIGIDNQQEYLDLSVKRFESLSHKIDYQPKLILEPSTKFVAESSGDYLACPADIEKLFNDETNHARAKKVKKGDG